MMSSIENYHKKRNVFSVTGRKCNEYSDQCLYVAESSQICLPTNRCHCGWSLCTDNNVNTETGTEMSWYW